jgi:DNA-binding CsgD family transcriptional regulator
MRKSQRVRLSELRRAYRLIYECREVGHDLAAWPKVMAEGLVTLIDTQVAIVGKIIIDRGKPPRNVHLADRGWASPQFRDVWYERHAVGHDYRGRETFTRFMSILSRVTTRSRAQLLDDAQWYRSFEYNELHRSINCDDLLVSASVSPNPDGLILFALMNARALGEPLFNSHQRRLLHLFNLELTLHIGKHLVLEPGASFADFPPHLRRTLECLLEGDSESQAALRLGLSRHTVHEYVTRLYRRLGVRSRPELMAYCLRHRFVPGRESL